MIMNLNRCTMTLLLLLAHSATTTTTWAMSDKATGIDFPDSISSLPIVGVGVRKKGPIKIYSVALYNNDSPSELASIKKSEKKRAFGILRSTAKKSSSTFLLEMKMKVGSEKMASAIADSVAPRHGGSKQDIESLKELILSGVSSKGAATKGTKLQFDCTNNGVGVLVDNENQGQVDSSNLAQAFCDVYLDDKCVSPALRQNCVDNCCAE